MQKRARIISSKSMSFDLMRVEPYQNKKASEEVARGERWREKKRRRERGENGERRARREM
jgi:hypothetical protein